MTSFSVDDTGRLDLGDILDGMGLDRTMVGEEHRILAPGGLAPVRVIGGRDTEVVTGRIHNAEDVALAARIADVVARKAGRGIHVDGGAEIGVAAFPNQIDAGFCERVSVAARAAVLDELRSGARVRVQGPVREVVLGARVLSTLPPGEDALIERFRAGQTLQPSLEDLREGARALLWTEGSALVVDPDVPYVKMDGGYRRTADLLAEVPGTIWFAEDLGALTATAWDAAIKLPTVDVSGFAGGIAPPPAATAPARRSDVDEMFGAEDTPQPRTGLVAAVLFAGLAVTVMGLACTSLPGIGVLLGGWYLAEVEGERVESGFYPAQARHTVQNLRTLASTAVILGIVALVFQGALIQRGFYVWYWSAVMAWIRGE
jgi:hypothetical protein